MKQRFNWLSTSSFVQGLRSDVPNFVPVVLFKACLSRFIPLLLIFTFSSIAVFAQENFPATVPARFQEEIFTDQVNNISDRRTLSLGIEETYIQKFYEFHVPSENAVTFHSRIIDESPEFTVEKNGKRFVRFFVPDIYYVGVLDKMKARFGEPVKVWAAMKLQGKASFHLWDPADEKAEPVRIKIERNWTANGKKMRINGAESVKQSVRNSDRLEESDRDFPLTDGEFYRERFGATLHNMDFSYSYLIRRIPKDALQRGKRLSFMPLHGLFGSALLATFAGRMSSSPQMWIRDHFATKYGEFVGQINMRGEWVEGHSQNVSVMIDRQTGKITKFYLKDNADLMQNPFAQALRGTLSASENRPWAVLNNNWIDSGASPLSKYAGLFTTDYVGQTLTNVTNNLVIQRKNVASFLQGYLRGVGLKLSDLSEASQQALEKLEKGEDPKLEVVYRKLSFTTSKYNFKDATGALAYIVQELTDKVTEQGFANFLTEIDMPRAQSLDQKELQEYIKIQMAEDKFNWATSDAETYYKQHFRFNRKYTAIPTKNGIFLYESDSKKPIGVAYGMSPAAQLRVKTMYDLVKINSLTCQKLFAD